MHVDVIQIWEKRAQREEEEGSAGEPSSEQRRYHQSEQ